MSMKILQIISLWCICFPICLPGCAAPLTAQSGVQTETTSRQLAEYHTFDVDPPGQSDAKIALGDSGSAIDESGRVDIAKTIDALVRMHANTFAYSIGESPSAWDQLPEFAEAAAQHGI